MNLIESLLDVLALIGIILTGGFLVFFLGDLLLSVLDPNYGSIFKRKKAKEEDERPVVKEAEEVKEPVKEEVKEEAPVVNEVEEEEKITFNDFDNLNNFDDEEALREQQMIEGVAAFSRDDAMAELKAEEERFKQEQLQQALARQQKVEEVEEEKEEFDLDSIFVEDEEDLSGFNFEEEQPVEESVEEETAEVEEEQVEEVEEVEEEPAEEEKVDEATLALLAEIEKLKNELEEAKALANKTVEVEVKTLVNGLSKEEVEAKIEELKARLKLNEKELKQAKKEYIPLNKIKKTLENDKKKLRRKEAIVAKQKVVLYGVNNVVDIDPEKQEKLSEDLALLDELRLSVQHCETVMKDNEERFPLLEKTYNILMQENANIKADIENMEEMLNTFNSEEVVAEEVVAEEVAEVVANEVVAENNNTENGENANA